MNKKEAVIIGAYTGTLLGDFSDLHEYIESIMGTPVMSHDMARKDFMEAVKEAAKPDFLLVCSEMTDNDSVVETLRNDMRALKSKLSNQIDISHLLDHRKGEWDMSVTLRADDKATMMFVWQEDRWMEISRSINE